MPLHRLREEQATLDVGAELPDHRAEVRVLGLVLQDHQRLYDVEPRLDHRRELAREDLERLRLDLLEDRADALLARGGKLGEALREQAADAELLPCAVRVRRMDLARELEPMGVDRRVCVGRHADSSYRQGDGAA